MASTKLVIGEGHLHGVHLEHLRRLQDAVQNAFAPNVRVSPLYDRDRGPGWIFFITIWAEDPENLNAPRVHQKPISWEVE